MILHIFECIRCEPEGTEPGFTPLVFVQVDHSGIDSAMRAVTGKHEL